MTAPANRRGHGGYHLGFYGADAKERRIEQGDVLFEEMSSLGIELRKSSLASHIYVVAGACPLTVPSTIELGC